MQDFIGLQTTPKAICIGINRELSAVSANKVTHAKHPKGSLEVLRQVAKGTSSFVESGKFRLTLALVVSPY
jgi:hypothetical protein